MAGVLPVFVQAEQERAALPMVFLVPAANAAVRVETVVGTAEDAHGRPASLLGNHHPNLAVDQIPAVRGDCGVDLFGRHRPSPVLPVALIVFGFVLASVVFVQGFAEPIGDLTDAGQANFVLAGKSRRLPSTPIRLSYRGR